MDQSKLLLLFCLIIFSRFYVYVQCIQTDYFWNDALNVMSFHRNKMNEYLCKNYIASEIIESYKNQSGEAFTHYTGNSEKPLKNSRLARESLLADPGSQKYKDWLSRQVWFFSEDFAKFESSTLEDIYRQFEHSDKDQTLYHEFGGGHEGDVTGYALVGHKQYYPKPADYGEDLYYHGHYKEEDDDHQEKGLKLKELFHFALTTIAFLAFACFMIEVIMCLMEVPQNMEPDYVLVPTTTGGTGPASKLESEKSDHIRQERTLNLDPMSLEILNTISSKVLSSIEALTVLHEDNGQCLKRSLCQNSKYSKSLKGIQKIWLPLWSFGMSWTGQRLSRKNPQERSSTLEYIKAAVMGLGDTECHVLYPRCDERRRRRRRKV